jgi:PleD family two-component response regulator
MTATDTFVTLEPSFRTAKVEPHRILVADDDATILRFNAEMLMAVGHEVDGRR